MIGSNRIKFQTVKTDDGKYAIGGSVSISREMLVTEEAFKQSEVDIQEDLKQSIKKAIMREIYGDFLLPIAKISTLLRAVTPHEYSVSISREEAQIMIQKLNDLLREV